MPFLPLHDDNPRILVKWPWVTYALIIVCCTVFWLEVNLEAKELSKLVYRFGMIPAILGGTESLPPNVAGVPPVATLLTYQFLHSDLFHLAFNMAFLWVFGDNIEDAMGHRRFMVFFLLTGVLAALAHYLADPGSVLPVIGASGSISGILGAYLLLHPKAKVLVHLVIFIPFYLPAYMLLILWIGFQVYSALQAGLGPAASVAWWAHIGGFLAGMLLIPLFRHKTIPLWDRNRQPQGVKIRKERSKKSRGPWS